MPLGVVSATPEAQPVAAGALAMPLAEVVVSGKHPFLKVARGSVSEKHTYYMPPIEKQEKDI